MDPEIEFTISAATSLPPTPSARAASINGSVIGVNRKRKVRFFGDEMEKMGEEEADAAPMKEQAVVPEAAM